MADRYWVGGNGVWSSTNTTNWSATSGGAGGASVPTSLDNVYINTSSGPLSLEVTTATGYTPVCYTFTMSRGTLSPGIIFNTPFVIGDVSGGANSGNFSITSGNVVYFAPIRIQGSTTGTPSTFSSPADSSIQADVEFASGSVQLTSNINISIYNILVKNGATFDVSGRSIIASDLEVESSGTLTTSSSFFTLRVWTLRSGAVVNSSGISILRVNVAFNDFGPTSRTYPSVAFTSVPSVDVPASVTFTAFALSGMRVKAGQTIYVDTLTNPSTSVQTLSTSNSPGQFTLSSPSGTKTLSFLNISNCNATGGATWVAPTSSVDSGNNTGIQFANSQGFLAFFG